MKNLIFATLAIVTLLGPVAQTQDRSQTREDQIADLQHDIDKAAVRVELYRNDNLRRSLWATQLLGLCFEAQNLGMKCNVKLGSNAEK